MRWSWDWYCICSSSSSASHHAFGEMLFHTCGSFVWANSSNSSVFNGQMCTVFFLLLVRCKYLQRSSSRWTGCTITSQIICFLALLLRLAEYFAAQTYECGIPTQVTVNDWYGDLLVKYVTVKASRVKAEGLAVTEDFLGAVFYLQCSNIASSASVGRLLRLIRNILEKQLPNLSRLPLVGFSLPHQQNFFDIFQQVPCSECMRFPHN